MTEEQLMKKVLFSLIIFVFIGISVFQIVSAVEAKTAKEQFVAGQDAAAKLMGYDITGDKISLSYRIGQAVKMVLTLLGIVFLALMIYGGFKWMKASGRESDVAAAKKIIENAIIGLIIVIAAYAITAYVGGAMSEVNSPVVVEDG
jgi:hypothetical protein